MGLEYQNLKSVFLGHGMLGSELVRLRLATLTCLLRTYQALCVAYPNGNVL